MKKMIYLAIFLLAQIMFAQTGQRQNADVDLEIFEPLPEAEFAAFVLSDVPGGQSRIFSIRITPVDILVKLEGKIEWQQEISGSFEEVHRFQTDVFRARTLTNLDIGRSDIGINNSNTNSDLAEEIFRRGRPMGTYRITIVLLDEQNNRLDTDVEEVSFTNPSQTITIRLPEANSIQDIGSVIMQWNNVIGASSYEILANVRRNENQSLEEAISQGTPVINNVDVGSQNVVNLRQYFTREPLPGQEIVAQVTAVISGPSGGTRLRSNIINFFIGNNNSPETEALRSRMISTFSTMFGPQGGSFLEMLRNGEIDLTTLVITDDTGKRITVAELEMLFNYLQANPDALINMQFQER